MFRQRPYGAFSEAISFKQEENMPTIIFDDNFNNKEKVIHSKTFKANCEHLDITNHDCTVIVHRQHLGKKGHQGSMSRLASDHFLVLLNSNGFNLFEGISVLGHEAVHIAQYLRGDLNDNEQGCCWRGQVFPKFICEASENYQHLPWEREAFDLQPKLHKRSLDILPRVDLKHVVDAS